MKRVLVPLAPGFEEIEAITVIDILRRADIEVVIAGTEPSPIKGRCQIKVVTDTNLDQVMEQSFDMVVLPGGLEGTENLKKNPLISKLLRKMEETGKYVSAICAGPTVLSAIGLIGGRRLTSHPSVRDSLNEATYLEERVVVDGHLVTSRAPGTAMEFAYKLVEVLVGKEKVQEVNQGVMAKI